MTQKLILYIFLFKILCASASFIFNDAQKKNLYMFLLKVIPIVKMAKLEQRYSIKESWFLYC